MINVNDVIWNPASAIAASDIVEIGTGPDRKPRVERIDKDPVGIIRIDRHALVVPILRIITTAGTT